MGNRRAFGLYSTGVPDGRRVVQVHVFEPERWTFWICATSRADALDRIRGLGLPNPRVTMWMRPLGAAVDAAAADAAGGVFRPDTGSVEETTLYSIASFHEYSSRAH